MRHQVWTASPGPQPPDSAADGRGAGDWTPLVDVVPGVTLVLTLGEAQLPHTLRWARVTDVDRGFESLVELSVDVAEGVCDEPWASALLQCTPCTRVLTPKGPVQADTLRTEDDSRPPTNSPIPHRMIGVVEHDLLSQCTAHRDQVPTSHLCVSGGSAYVLTRFCGDDEPGMPVWVEAHQKAYGPH